MSDTADLDIGHGPFDADIVSLKNDLWLAKLNGDTMNLGNVARRSTRTDSPRVPKESERDGRSATLAYLYLDFL